MKAATLALVYIVIVAGQNTTVNSSSAASQNATANSSSAAGQNGTVNSGQNTTVNSSSAPIIFGVFTFLGPGAPGLVPAPIVTESLQNTTAKSAQNLSGVIDLRPTFTFGRDTANPCLAAHPCQKLTVDNLNLEQAWDGCLFAAETVVLSSGVLTLDLGTALLDSQLCLWASSGAPEGKFSAIQVLGSSSCLAVRTETMNNGDFMAIFEGSTCASGAVIKMICVPFFLCER